MAIKPERPNTVAGLIAKRTELASYLKHLRAEERKVVSDLDHIDAAIRLFDKATASGRIGRHTDAAQVRRQRSPIASLLG